MLKRFILFFCINLLLFTFVPMEMNLYRNLSFFDIYFNILIVFILYYLYSLNNKIKQLNKTIDKSNKKTNNNFNNLINLWKRSNQS